jgi:hypothetical protein
MRGEAAYLFALRQEEIRRLRSFAADAESLQEWL